MRFHGSLIVGASLALTLGITCSAPLAANPLEPINEFGVFLGGGMIDKSLSGENTKAGPVAGLRLACWVCENWALFGDLTYGRYDTELSTDKLAVWTARLGPELYLSKPEKKWRWFVAPAAGWTYLDFGNALNENWLSVSLGFGQRVKVTADGRFSWQIRGEQYLGGEIANHGTPFTAQLLVGYAWAFGPRLSDSDGDGVPDCKDHCPATPTGATVDARGCPHDSDGDGVYDGIDRCPDTPKGVQVDQYGCPLDSDGDGVPDYLDKCPNTPKGVKVDAKGCPLDSDGDGVPDYLDKCPDTPKGVKVDGKGCPLDSDGDGVPDYLDKCPNTPKGVKVDATGCPIEQPKPPPPPPKTLVLGDVFFDTAKSTLKPEGMAELDKVAASLKEWPDVRIEIAGYTDSVGGDKYNKKLSEDRAKAVRDYLVSKGLAAARFEVNGYGKTKPVADNKTAEGRAKNRRVELNRLN